MTEERQPNTELLCNSESPEPSTYCTMVLGHKGNCSWERCPICKKPTTNYIQGWKHDDGSELCQPNTELRREVEIQELACTVEDYIRDRPEEECYEGLKTLIRAFAASIQAEARAQVKAAWDLIVWMSGSDDFGPSGKAYKGWIKAKAVREAIQASVEGEK